jgi:hypothetical protein
MRLRAGLVVALAAAAAAGPARAGCPQTAIPLAAPPTAVEQHDATRVAVRWARRTYAVRRSLLTDRMGATAVSWAPQLRALAFVRTACGVAAWSATVAVTVVFPVMWDDPPRPFARCDYCAGVVVLVTRGRSGWRVWDAL